MTNNKTGKEAKDRENTHAKTTNSQKYIFKMNS